MEKRKIIHWNYFRDPNDLNHNNELASIPRENIISIVPNVTNPSEYIIFWWEEQEQ